MRTGKKRKLLPACIPVSRETVWGRPDVTIWSGLDVSNHLLAMRTHIKENMAFRTWVASGNSGKQLVTMEEHRIHQDPEL